MLFRSFVCAVFLITARLLCRTATTRSRLALRRSRRSALRTSSGMTISWVVNLCSFAHSLLRLYPCTVDSLASLTIVQVPQTGHFIFRASQKFSFHSTRNETNSRCPLSHAQRIGACMCFDRRSFLRCSCFGIHMKLLRHQPFDTTDTFLHIV